MIWPFVPSSIRVGVDLSDEAVRVVEYQPAGRMRGARIRTATVPIPPGAYFEGVIYDRPAVVKSIRRALERAKVRTRRAVMAVAPQASFIRKTAFPVMPEAEVRSVVALQQERYIPMPRESTHFDLAILPQKPEEKQMWAVIAAAPEPVIRGLMETAKLAGLRLTGIDMEPLALYRAARLSRSLAPDEVVGLVDIGSRVVKISMLEAGAPLLSRVVQVPEGAGGGAWQKDADTLFLDIRRSLEFTLNHVRTPPSRVLLTGGAAVDDYLALSLYGYLHTFLQSRIQSAVQVQVLQDERLSLSPDLMLALGLSLAGGSEHDKH